MRYSTPVVFPNFGIPTVAFIQDIQLRPLIEYNAIRYRGINEIAAIDAIFSVGAEIATDISFFNLGSLNFSYFVYYNVLLANEGINENQRLSGGFNFRLPLPGGKQHQHR